VRSTQMLFCLVTQAVDMCTLYESPVSDTTDVMTGSRKLKGERTAGTPPRPSMARSYLFNYPLHTPRATTAIGFDQAADQFPALPPPSQGSLLSTGPANSYIVRHCDDANQLCENSPGEQ
jgi:hypothetical protein